MGRNRPGEFLRGDKFAGRHAIEVLRHHIVESGLCHGCRERPVDVLNVARLPTVTRHIEVGEGEIRDCLAAMVDQIVRGRWRQAGRNLFRLLIGEACHSPIFVFRR